MAVTERAPRRGSAGSTHPWVFVVPAFAVIAVFFLTPTVYNFVYAFTDWSSFKSAINGVGLDNFAELARSGALRHALTTTLLYAAGVAVIQNLFGLGLALLVERDTALNKVLRVVFFIPVVISALAAGYVFRALLKPDGGLNQVLSALVGHTVDIGWLSSTTWTLVVVILIHSWKWMGMSMLIYLAGLKTIDGQVLEAAVIDGATPWQILTRIRLPLIAPAITFNVTTALLGSMNSFDVVQATTNGGPGGSTELLNLFIYRTFGQGLYAQATTMSLVLFLTVVVLAVPVIGMLRRRERSIA